LEKFFPVNLFAITEATKPTDKNKEHNNTYGPKLTSECTHKMLNLNSIKSNLSYMQLRTKQLW